MLFGVTPWKHKNEKILLRMMKESKIGEDVFSSLQNQQLIDFILKSVEIFERKRMKIE